MVSAGAGNWETVMRIWRFVHRIAYRIWLALLAARVAVVVAALAILTLDAVISRAHAQTAQPDYAQAYAMAMRCMVFNTYYKDDPHARLAFDAAVRLGHLQGFTNTRLNDDIDAAIARESVQFHQHADYRQQTQVNCRALGWAQ